MKTIIAGSRNITDVEVVTRAIERSGIKISLVLSGKAKGVDILGELWARENNISVEGFLPDWKRFGRSAGLKRNIEMIENADAIRSLRSLISSTVQVLTDVYCFANVRLLFHHGTYVGPVHKLLYGMGKAEEQHTP